MAATTSFGRTRVWVLILLALSCLPYANSILNGFVIDDPFVYSDNHFIRSLGNLSHLFDRSYFLYSGEASYRPVCTATYFLDWALWRGWPGGPHLTNVLLYAGLVVLLFFLFRGLTGSQPAAFLGAAFFALHPVHTEVVNNIAFREDLLVPLFLAASWQAFRSGQRGRRWVWLPLAWVSYLFALFSKEGAVVFPVLAAVLLYAALPAAAEESRGGAVRARAGWGSLPAGTAAFLAGLIVCTGLFLAIRFHWMQFAGEANQPRLGGSLVGTLLADVKIQAYYFYLFIFPGRLQALYPARMHSPTVDPAFFASLAVLLAILALLIAHRRSRLFVAGMLFWVVSLAPVSNLYPIFNPMAERYLFLPSVGLCLWAGWGISTWLAGRFRRAAVCVCMVAAALMAVLVFIRNPAWRDNLTVWGGLARVTPKDPTVLSNLAAAYYEKGQYDKVIPTAERALILSHGTQSRFDPTPCYVALGCAHFLRGDKDKALACFQSAEARLPCRFDMDAAVYRNIAMIFEGRGDFASAAAYYEKTAAIDPFRAELWCKLAHCQLRAGKRPDAERSWDRARRLDRKVPPFADLESAVRR